VKIRDVEIYIVAGREGALASPWASASVIVRVLSSDGEVGYGEAIPTRRVNQVVRAIEELRRLVVGRDAHSIPSIYWDWYKHEYYLYRSIESVSAYSAIDIAIHDMLGKRYGVPVYMLIGGLARDRVKVYANGWYSGAVTPDDFARMAREAVSRGFRALKFDPFGPYFDTIDRRGVEEAVERVRAVREAVGRYVDILVEFHGRFNVPSAVEVVRALEQFDPLFYEEPVHPDLGFEALKRVRMATSVRIALGERILTPVEALEAARSGAVDVLQPDVVNCLGFTGITRIRAIAEAHSIELAPHNAFGPIQHAATLQFDASTNNLLIQESFYEYWPEWKRRLIRDPFRVEDGYQRIPSRPGLGVEVDERTLEEYRVQSVEVPYSDEPVWVVRGTWKSYSQSP